MQARRVFGREGAAACGIPGCYQPTTRRHALPAGVSPAHELSRRRRVIELAGSRHEADVRLHESAVTRAAVQFNWRCFHKILTSSASVFHATRHSGGVTCRPLCRLQGLCTNQPWAWLTVTTRAPRQIVDPHVPDRYAEGVTPMIRRKEWLNVDRSQNP